ncbi:MAG: family 16 glycosylhydrolase [Muribaculaceae bacterium]|nr:family 16 glycosylhydrolase [Muribaculaceae bacterium]
MKKIIIPAIFLACAPALMAQDDIADKYPGYRLEFAEEFNEGTVPDPDRWVFETGMRRNHEDQVYTTDNATIKDGMLVIEARKEQVLNPDYQRYGSQWNQKNKYGEYSSASIILKDPYRYHYGVYEVRAKIPVGTGYWPAIWGCGDTYEWPYNGELDIMEYYGDAIHANLAWGTTTRWNAAWASKAPKMNEFEGDFADNFHIWRTEWDHNSLRIYLDGRLLNETNLDITVNPNPKENWYNVDGYNPYRDPENKFGVWLNLALGGDNGGSLTNTAFPAQYLVDYVRVYVPESADAALKYRIHKARTLLDENSESEKYSQEAVTALENAIDDAEKLLGATDDDVIDPALDALQAAMDNFLKSMPNDCADGGTFRFRHLLSGATLSSGWFEEKECVIITDNNASGYHQDFTFVEAPGIDKSKGMNMRTADGKYVYRDSWNLYVTDNTDKLADNNFLFLPETAEGYYIIKNLGTGKYFGTDNNVPWSHVYSDKPGFGARSNYFELIESAGIDNVTADDDLSCAVYNLQGVRVADSVDTLSGNGIYIVVRGNRATKIVL